MNSLVAYGSNSDSSDDESSDNGAVGYLVPQQSKEPAKATSSAAVLTTDDDFDAVLVEPGESSTSQGLFGELPAMTEISSAPAVSGEDNLEDFVTEMKPWEKKLREKAEAKKQKRLAKSKKKEKKGKVKIAAFAANNHDDEDADAEAEAEERRPCVLDDKASNAGLSGLLSLLPPPKSAGGKGMTIDIFPTLAPRSVSVPKKVAPVVEPTPINAAVDTNDSDSDSDDGDSADFFGLSSNDPKRSKLNESSGPSEFKINIQPAQHRGEYGPAKPPAVDEAGYGNSGYDEPSSSDVPRQPSARNLSDEKAFNLIYKHEMQPWGFSDRNAAQAVESIVDVDMNDRLVDVRATLLRNMNNTQTAEVSAAVTAKNVGEKKKATRDISSKRKHQITYLADLAVSRDEQLREQWGQNRHAQTMSKRKYGF